MDNAIPALKVNLTVYMTPSATLVEIPAGIFAVPDLQSLADWLQSHRPAGGGDRAGDAARPVSVGEEPAAPPPRVEEQAADRPAGRGWVAAVRDAEGNEYPSMTAAAKAVGVSLSYISHCVRFGLHGWERLAVPGQTAHGKMGGFRQEVIGPDGKLYRSKREAANTANVSLRLMDDWINDPKSGWKLGEKRRWIRQPVALRAPDGRVFDSITEAAEAEGVTKEAFNYRVKKLGWQRIEAS